MFRKILESIPDFRFKGFSGSLTALVLLISCQCAYAVPGDCNNNGIPDSSESDRDGDAVIDACDNCLQESNPDQLDTDNDGYGNICDADFDNNLIVNAADLGYLKSMFFTTDLHADLDGSGVVNAGDLGILKSFFFKSPGPGLPDLGERLSANFVERTLDVDEGAGTVTIRVDFGVLTQGQLYYTVTGVTADADVDYIASSGPVNVDGRFAEISIDIINDDIVSEEVEIVSLKLEPGTGYELGPFNELTLSILDNDAVWYGVLQASGGEVDILLEITDSETAGLQGALRSDGYGSFPIGVWPAAINSSADSFGAVIDPVAVSAQSTMFQVPFTRGITLDAVNIPDGQDNPEFQIVTENLVRGIYTEYLYSTDPDSAHLDRIITGTFSLTREAPLDTTWEPPL